MKKTTVPYESPKTMKAEIGFMKKGGAPKKLIDSEKAEHKAMSPKMGVKKGGRGR